ncbi:MAG: S-layer homology domain-containing protein, partial [Peptococcaceae bacterium]|nr:S-layer homology domain-containing protein [Peptococcaceae bacterium]
PAAPTAPAAPAQPGETEKTETQPNSAAWVNPFTDVNTSDWFYSEIEYAYTHGLFAGTSADAFSPNTPMTRGMIVTVLARLYGADVKEYTVSGFDDVAAGKYYTPYVEWAKQNGVVNGVGDNKFAPDAEITRQDLAVIITNYARFANKQFPVTLQYQIFADEADIAEYAKSAVQTLYCGNIIGGKPNNIFDPKGSATRAEVAAILHRFVVNTSV